MVIETLSVEELLSYCEFLYSNHYSPSAIANALAGIKSKMQSYGLKVVVFSDIRINYFLKSLRLNQPFRAKMPHLIDFKLLRQISQACNKLPHHLLFRSVYLVAFYSFLRISNLVPHSVRTFSPLQHLARGDVLFAPPGVHLLVKWSKTLQNKDKVVILKLPAVADANICPVQHLCSLLHVSPGHQDSPLFQIQMYNKWVPLTDSRLRKHLKDVLTSLNLQKSNITFHSFRKSGASLAFQGQASLQSIKVHGTWSSDTVWTYSVQNQDGSAEVAHTLATLAQE